MMNLKKYIANILGFFLLLFFGNSAIKQFDRRVLSVYFHNPSPLLFQGIIRFLISKGFRFIDEEEYLKIYMGEQRQTERLAFVSLDDGWWGNLKLIPIIEKYTIPITVFIPVKPVISGNYWWEYAPAILARNKEFASLEELKKLPNRERMKLLQMVPDIDMKRSCVNLTELKELAQHPLVRIGSHSYHHPITLRCTDKELEFEYRESKQALEQWLGIQVNSFSYPNGDFNERDLYFLQKYGYKMAFTVEADLSPKWKSEFMIPRVSMNTKGGKYENLARMLRIWHRYVQPVQQFHIKPFLRNPGFSKIPID